MWSTREYLLSVLRDELETYVARVLSDPPQHYTHPHIHTPSGFTRKQPNPVLSYLTDRDPGSGIPNGALGILLAEPGQGKTYMCRYLAAAVDRHTSHDIVPVMISANQWRTMPVEDQSSLWKTITHSFRYYDAPIPWLEGHEKEFLATTLSADMFRIIFDGFDEYILRNRGAVQPIEVLDALTELASQTGTRIVLTSRTHFWETALPEDEVQRFIAKTGSFVYTLLPFEEMHAKNYFAERLGEAARIHQALQLFVSLRHQSPDLVGRGFVLSLIADLVERGKSESTRSMTEGADLMWLLREMCQREEERQGLPYTASQQMEFLQEVATNVALGETPSSDMLELLLSLVRPDLEPAIQRETLRKLASHPIIRFDPIAQRWRFTQEQIWFVILADVLLELKRPALRAFLERVRLEDSTRQDLVLMLVRLIWAKEPDSGVAARVQAIVTATTGTRLTSESSAQQDSVGRFGGLLALLAVEKLHPKGSSRADRTETLLQLFGGDGVCGAVFRGTVARFDLRGTRFDGCRFEHVTWANCTFDEDTTFSHCHFSGALHLAHCTGFDSVALRNTTFDAESAAIFDGLLVSAGKRKYSEDDLTRDLQLVLRKFFVKGGLGLKTLSAQNLRTGPINFSPARDRILEVLASTVLEGC